MTDYTDRLALRALSDVQPRRLQWLYPGLIPRKTITLVAGVGGLGKSTWLADVSARVSRGALGGEPGDVLLVSFEDTAAEVLRPRVEAAEGDLTRVHEVVVDRLDIDPVCLPKDLGDLETLVEQVKAKLLIIDPIVAGLEMSIDAYKDQHVRVVLAQLAALAEEKDLAVVIVGHLNKAPSREPYLRIGGSTAFYNASRSVVLVTEDNGDPDMRLISQDKANYSRRNAVERHRIEEIMLPGTVDPDTGDPIVTSRMVFVEVADDVDEADLLAPPEAVSKSTREADAVRFLIAELAAGEWVDSASVKVRAAAAEIKERTLKRAMRDTGVEVDRRGFPAVTYWRLGRANPSHANSSRANLVPENLARLEEARNHARFAPPAGPLGPAGPTRIEIGPTGSAAYGNGAGELTEIERARRFDEMYPPKRKQP